MIYGRVVYFVPSETFVNIVGNESIQLYTQLVRLNYIDKEGFITEEFNGDLTYLDDQYK